MKKIRTNFLWGGVLLCLMAIAGLTSCNHDLSDHFGVSDNPSTGVTEITIDLTALDAKYLNDEKTQLKLQVGDEVTLSFTIKPDELADTEVTLTPDDPTIVSIDGKKVKALLAGTTKVTAKAGDKTATCEVTVTPGLATPLTVEAITQGKITVTFPQSGMKYSTDGGVTKLPVSSNPTEIPVAAGDKVAFYGTNTSYYGTYIGGADDGGTFKCKVYGNIMSLLYEDFADRTELPANETFNQLFKDNARLTDASGLLLPAMTLVPGCYRGMFNGCTALTQAPQLPAENLSGECYEEMFQGCENLTTAPELPATTLKSSCYQSMFAGCTSLTTAPELPATMLLSKSYYQMFQNCTHLNSVTCYATDILAMNCLDNWLDGVAATGTIKTKATMVVGTWTAGGNYPTGWTHDTSL